MGVRRVKYAMSVEHVIGNPMDQRGGRVVEFINELSLRAAETGRPGVP